jgi:hypothetical protein
MNEFVAAALSLPTVIFTVPVVVFVLHSIATLIGAADIEWLDGLLGIDDVNDTDFEGALQWLGVAGIPFVIFGGLCSVFAWLTSYTADRFLPNGLWTDTGIGIGSALVGLILGALTVRPLRQVFATAPARQRSEIVGRICVIRSLHVDAQRGTAEIGDYIAEVRCFRDNELTLGSKAIVYDYDAQEGIYHVGPIDPSLEMMDVARTEIA